MNCHGAVVEVSLGHVADWRSEVQGRLCPRIVWRRLVADVFNRHSAVLGYTVV
jgi:hypothetical protein